MRIDKTRKFIIDKLNENFVDSSYYHGVQHPLDVEAFCLHVCQLDKSISDLDKELLQVAALSHDIGHSVKRIGHEELGCEFISCYLPDFGYTESEIEIINNLILATKFPHNPQTKLEEIICDADLSYIGTGDYQLQVDKLKKELVELDKHKFETEDEWLNFQLTFLEEHKYFTEYAIKVFNPKKEKIIDSLKLKLSNK